MSTDRIGSYELGEDLGEGTYGRVYAAHHVETNRQVAVKKVLKSILDQSKRKEQIQNEIKILSQACHRNIIELIEVIETDDCMCLVMEYACAGDFYTQIASRGPLPEPEASRLFAQLLSALKYIHGLGYVHGDIKLENLMFDDFRTRRLKVIDFGIATLTKDPTTNCKRRLFQHRGTPAYAAPEVINVPAIGYDGEKADAWSAGVVLFAMLCGHLPFESKSFAGVAQQITRGHYKMCSHVSPGAQELVGHLLDTCVGLRFSIADAMKHPWVSTWVETDEKSMRRSLSSGDLAAAVADHRNVDANTHSADAETFSAHCVDDLWEMTGDMQEESTKAILPPFALTVGQAEVKAQAAYPSVASTPDPDSTETSTTGSDVKSSGVSAPAAAYHVRSEEAVDLDDLEEEEEVEDDDGAGWYYG